MKRQKTKVTGYILIIIAFFVIAAVIYENSAKKNVPIVFSARSMIDSVWQRYKAQYMEKDTYRVMDLARGGVTTSEGESYAMLRSVWLDDHPTFDKSWQWTKDNLQKQGHLFSWLFGKSSNGTYGILVRENGQNTASDADSDIALALAFAYARWKDPQYLADAKLVITDMWNKEVIIIQGKPYLASSIAEKTTTGPIAINPSYFAPYAYRIFAVIDPDHDWNGLIGTSYDILEKSTVSPLNKSASAGLPPDWVTISRTDGSIVAEKNADLDTNFSYDALRVPWRVALDWYWNKEPRAKAYLSSFSFLGKEWQKNGALVAGYAHDGTALTTAQAPSFYGGVLPAFMLMDANEAKDMYENKLVVLYNPDSNSWKQPLDYYDDNWAWFGISLYNNELPNLWALVK
jgi:endo-1,4-beta-D-glucanase Y